MAAERTLAEPSKGDRLGRYLVAHWQGELSLATSFWLNGVLAYAVLLAIVLGLRSYLPIYPALAVFLAFSGWACVGVTRSALRIVRSSQESITRKFKAYLALSVVVAVIVGWVGDFALLLR
jgi:hypothetical protein